LENTKIQKIAHLAKLIIREDEAASFEAKLDSVMKMIEQLNLVDCSGVEPLRSVCDMNLTMRDDIVNDGNKVDEILFNAPGKTSNLAKKTHFFVVPKVIE
jgi:aspartyl-tRNA(Asn)/glutamyl-tRNA(Gln) amidotransferase subunit C